jgi:hypothetical protein
MPGMDTSPTPPTVSDPFSVLARLTLAEVRARLDDIEAERKGLLSLLRTLRARERAALRRQGVPHAAN